MAVGLEEGHILLAAELTREFVDVHRLVIIVHVLVLERLFRHEVHNVVLLVNAHHRTVHPRLVLGYQCQVGIRIFHNHGEQAVAEDEVALDKQRIVLLHLVLHQ